MGGFPAILPSRFFRGRFSGIGRGLLFAMFHTLFTILADASPAGAPAGPGGFNIASFVPIVLIGVIFYFLAIRPQSLRQKQQDALIKSVKTGDKVITGSGIH